MREREPDVEALRTRMARTFTTLADAVTEHLRLRRKPEIVLHRVILLAMAVAALVVKKVMSR